MHSRHGLGHTHSQRMRAELQKKKRKNKVKIERMTSKKCARTTPTKNTQCIKTIKTISVLGVSVCVEVNETKISYLIFMFCDFLRFVSMALCVSAGLYVLYIQILSEATMCNVSRFLVLTQVH